MIVTAEHASLNQTHDATTVWIEELGATSFKICLRELQSFDGHHKDIHVVCFRGLEWGYPVLSNQLISLAFLNNKLVFLYPLSLIS